MLKNNTVEMKIYPATYNKYYDKYGPYNINDVIVINTEDLSECCSIKVIAICEICGVESVIKYQTYLIQLNNGGYYCCKKCGISKIKNTNLERYGCEYGLSNKNVQNKSKITCLEKYGVDNVSKSDGIKEKKENTCFEHYGVYHYTKTKEHKEKVKKTCMEKYNVDNPSKYEKFKKKKIETTLKNWGVENPTQSYILFEKSQISGKKMKLHENMNLLYRGTYEKDFLDFCFKNNIKVEKGLTIKFKCGDKNKVYHSDFYIKEKNMVIEIKSTFYYNRYLELNKIKEKETRNQGYEYLIIMDKNYDKFKNII